MTEFDELMRSPSKYFSTPAEVLEHPELNRSQKSRVLTQWKNEIGQLQAATAENMPGPPTDELLQSINAALGQLEG